MTDVLPIETWQRSAFEPGARNVFQLFCFVTGPLADVPMSALRFGLPSTNAMNGVEVQEIPRSADPQWFDGFRSGALRTLATEALGDAMQAFDTADRLAVVLIDTPDTADLGHVQAGWALAKWLVARGASVVLDAQSNRFWKGAELADWPTRRPFALSVDVNVIVEAEPEASIAIVHTRGLQKFGRPDLVVLDVPADRWDPVAGILRVLAAQSADGRCFKPGDRVTVGVDPILFSAFTSKALHLNNEALVVAAG